MRMTTGLDDVLLGGSVSRFRRSAGLSTPELSALTGIDTLELWLKEEGRRRFTANELCEVARAVGVTLETLQQSCSRALSRLDGDRSPERAAVLTLTVRPTARPGHG